MSTHEIEPTSKLTVEEATELGLLAERVRRALQRSAQDILTIGADLIQAKEMLGHGRFGPWLDQEFALSRRSAEQFMAAARRFGTRSEAVAHLPAGAVLELSAPSVPEELVHQVLSGEVPASVTAIRQEKRTARGDDRAFAVAGTFIDHIARFGGTDVDVAAAIAAHVLRRWKDPAGREWFASCLIEATRMLEANLERRVPMLELPRTTVRRLLLERDS